MKKAIIFFNARLMLMLVAGFIFFGKACLASDASVKPVMQTASQQTQDQGVQTCETKEFIDWENIVLASLAGILTQGVCSKHLIPESWKDYQLLITFGVALGLFGRKFAIKFLNQKSKPKETLSEKELALVNKIMFDEEAEEEELEICEE